MEEALAEIEDLAEHGMTDTYLFGIGAGEDSNMSEDQKDRIRRWWRAATTPRALADLERMNLDIDIRGVLPSIHVPTLVMNRTNDPVADVEAARDLATHIEGARFVEFPGDTHAFFHGADSDEVADEIQEFVTGSRPAIGGDRALATVLFTDIVGSTRTAADLGDHEWRGVVERHHTIVRDLLARSRGIEMDTAGDGFFATFDGPARAVRCALAAVEAVRPLGIEIRAGVHTGEIETIRRQGGRDRRDHRSQDRGIGRSLRGSRVFDREGSGRRFRPRVRGRRRARAEGRARALASVSRGELSFQLPTRRGPSSGDR